MTAIIMAKVVVSRALSSFSAGFWFRYEVKKSGIKFKAKHEPVIYENIHGFWYSSPFNTAFNNSKPKIHDEMATTRNKTPSLNLRISSAFIMRMTSEGVCDMAGVNRTSSDVMASGSSCCMRHRRFIDVCAGR